MPRILWWVRKGWRICFIQQCIFIQQRLPVHRVRACYALLQLQIMISRISLRVSYTHIYYLCPPMCNSLRRIYSYLPLDLCVSEKIKLIGGANWRTHYLYSYVLISPHPWHSLIPPPSSCLYLHLTVSRVGGCYTFVFLSHISPHWLLLTAEHEHTQQQDSSNQPVAAPRQTTPCQCRVIWIVAAPQICRGTDLGAVTAATQPIHRPVVFQHLQIDLCVALVQCVDVCLAAHLQSVHVIIIIVLVRGLSTAHSVNGIRGSEPIKQRVVRNKHELRPGLLRLPIQPGHSIPFPVPDRCWLWMELNKEAETGKCKAHWCCMHRLFSVPSLAPFYRNTERPLCPGQTKLRFITADSGIKGRTPESLGTEWREREWETATYRKYNVVYPPGEINRRIGGTGNAAGLQLVPVIDVPFIVVARRHAVDINRGLHLRHHGHLHLGCFGQRVEEGGVRRNLALIEPRVVARHPADRNVVRIRFGHLSLIKVVTVMGEGEEEEEEARYEEVTDIQYNIITSTITPETSLKLRAAGSSLGTYR